MKIKISEFDSFYINLNKDIDKKNNTESILNKCGFKNFSRIEGVEVSITKEANAIKTIGQIYGCLLSHKKAMYKKNANFIIFEDDIDEVCFVDEIEIPDDADALYLGHMSWGLINGAGYKNSVQYEEVQGFPNIYRVYNALSTHAILYISESYVKKCRDAIEESINSANFLDKNFDANDISADVLFAKLHPDHKIYALGLPAFYQVGYYEEDTNKHIEEYTE